MDALVVAIARHLRVEAPHVACPVALRLNLHATSEGLSPDAQQLFLQVSRLLGQEEGGRRRGGGGTAAAARGDRKGSLRTVPADHPAGVGLRGDPDCVERLGLAAPGRALR